MARPAQQGHRPFDRLQLWSLYGFLNRQDHEDMPLRHEGMSTFDELQTAAPARFSALSDHIPVVVQNGHNNLVGLHQEREEHCEYLSLLHYRNVHHSVEEHEELEELLELVAEDHRDVHNQEERVGTRTSGASSFSSFSFSSEKWTKRNERAN